MWRWDIGGAVALLLAFGIVAGVSTRDGDWGDDRWGDDGRVERIVDADGTETIVVHDVRNHGFPFGIIVVPLVILGLFALARGIFGRGHGGPGRWGGPGGPGGPGAWGYGPPWAYSAGGYGGPGTDPAASQAPATPPWFEEWHRRTHEGQPTATPEAGSPSQPAAPPPPAVD